MISLDRLVIEAVHAEQLERHGSGTGIRDPGLLESALAGPLNRVGYGEPNIAELAAVCALGIAKNRHFIDGNKRTAYVALETFIILNGMTFPVSDAEAVVAMMDMASGDMTDDEFITWMREHARN